MINGLHLLLYSRDPDADRAFLRDVLGWPFVENGAGSGWLIFKAPPTEVGVHPTGDDPVTEVHLMCDDIEATVTDLAARGVTTSAVTDVGYGRAVTVELPSGARIGLYEPRHEIAYTL